jgi:hypothetical protein
VLRTPRVVTTQPHPPTIEPLFDRRHLLLPRTAPASTSMKINLPFRVVPLLAGLLLSPLAADAQIEIPLRKIKAPNNSVNDGEYGVSMTYPTGWNVVRAFRWGQNNEKTTIVLQRTQRGSPVVSFFYQKFGGEAQRPPEIRDWFRTSFHEKQAAKQKELPNYRNDPDSLTYETTAGGLPKCSYIATFTKGSGRLVEYYVRVAGEKTYVMFLTQGTRSEIDALRADIDQMANTLRLP